MPLIENVIPPKISRESGTHHPINQVKDYILEKLTKIPRMIDLRDFMELDSIEFQNRIFKEIDGQRQHYTSNSYHWSR